MTIHLIAGALVIATTAIYAGFMHGVRARARRDCLDTGHLWRKRQDGNLECARCWLVHKRRR